MEVRIYIIFILYVSSIVVHYHAMWRPVLDWLAGRSQHNVGDAVDLVACLAMVPWNGSEERDPR